MASESPPIDATQAPLSRDDAKTSPLGAMNQEYIETNNDDYLNGLEVDSNDTDTESEITDLNVISTTTSIQPSSSDFVEENGRTYHKYKEGKYLLPNDRSEQERLDLQHHLWPLMLKDKLYLAPVTAPQRVLDVGTGTGIWAIDYANQNPSAEVTGTDLSPIQPQFTPPNCHFQVADAEDAWTYPHQFNLIHGRLLFSAFDRPPLVIRHAFSALLPGGYLEMQEVFFKLHSLDGSIQDTAFARWNDMLVAGAKVIGRDWHCTVRYKQWFMDAGFVDVVVVRFPGPIGTWPKGEREKAVGRYWRENMLEGVQGMSNVVLRRGLGMEREEMESLLGEVRRDLRDGKIHSYWPMYVVYGRKPK